MDVLDDDLNTHDLWRMKFNEIDAVNTLFFNSADSLKDWFRNGHQSQNDLYFVDYELSKGGETGLDLIRSLDIKNQAVLVTHRDDSNLVQRCEDMKVRLFPKKYLQNIKLIKNFEPLC